MRFAALSLSALAVALVCAPTPAGADEPKPLDPAARDFFEKKIRPVLIESCYSCHSAEAEKNKKLKGTLYLDSRDALLKGGDTGPAVVPGKPNESLLLKSMHYDGDLRMPPKGKLSDAVLKDFEKWIAMGAPDPRTYAALAPKKQSGLSYE